MRVRGERAKYFGRGKDDEYLRSDVAMKGLDLIAKGSVLLSKQPRDLRELDEGFVPNISAAQPLSAPTAIAVLERSQPDKVSHGWAIGKDFSASGYGMLVANQAWVGANRFWEKHLIIREGTYSSRLCPILKF